MQARANCLSGIVNGIDYGDFNPATDTNIARTYSVENFRKEKVKNKMALQEELGLERSAPYDDRYRIQTDRPEGFDLIDCVMDELCQDAVQIVVLGTGDERYENMFRHFAWKYPDKVSAQIYLFRADVFPQDLCIL